MHIICTQENLNQGVSIVEKIVGRNTTLPVLNNILLKTEKGGFKFSSTNLEIGINCWIRGKIKEKGGITIPAKTFSNFVSSLPKKNLTLKTTKNKLNLFCEEFRAEIKGMEEKNFPLIPKIKSESVLDFKTQILKNGLSQVVPATALSESRPEIAGVLMSIKPSQLTLVATDTYRLAKKVIKDDNLTRGDFSVIIPSATIYEFLRIFNEEKEKTKLTFDKNQILFSAESSTQAVIRVELLSRLIEGKYPNYEEIIPENFEVRLKFLKEELIDKIKVVSPFSSKVNDIKLEIKDSGLIEISAISPEVGVSTATIKTKTPRDPSLGEITFNYKYLLDGLESISTRKVELLLNTKDSPAALKPEDKDDFLYLIMPIKT